MRELHSSIPSVWSAVLCTAFPRHGAPGHCVPIQSGAERRTPYGYGSWRSLTLLITWIATWVSPDLPGDVITENFSRNPAQGNTWWVAGDPSHFSWNADRQRLDVTWDSTRPNAFFLRPLPTILTRAESFRFRFRLQVTDMRTTPGESTFQLAAGLVRSIDTQSSNFFRGAGVHPVWGPRNLIEFDYFPPSEAVTATFSAVAVATNNTRWAMVNRFPFELEAAVPYEIEIRHTAASSQLELEVLRDGLPMTRGTTSLDARFGDFRVDAFAVISYNGSHQPAGYGGQILAHGSIDDIEIEFPAGPRVVLRPSSHPEPATFALDVIPGWMPVLERRVGTDPWQSLPAVPVSANLQWHLTDTEPPPFTALYRARLERP